METTNMEGTAVQPQDMAMNPEFWHYIFDAIEDPVFLHDAQFRVLLANHAYCREAGMTKVEAIGKYYWDVFPLGNGPQPGCKDAVSGKNCTSGQDEVKVGEKCFLSNSYVKRDGQGQHLYSLHLLHDITAQRLTMSALAESEERFRRITETACDAIITLDGESGTVTEWNLAAEAMFGYSKHEVLGRVLHEIITPPRFRDEAMKGMARFAISGQGAAIDKTMELVALHKSGTEFPIELSLSAMQIHGKWFAIGSVRNISARKMAEESAWINQALFSTIFKQAPLGIALIDSFTGKIYELNPRFAEITGRTIEEMASIDWMSLTYPEDVQKDLDNMALLNAGKIPGFKMDKRYIRPDGSIVWVNMTIAPLKNEGISPRHLCMIDDITENKLAEEEIRKLNEALEVKVLKRTKQLLEAQEELVRKEKLAVLGQVAGSVGHELRNPLGVISNAVYFLQTVLSDADKTTKEYLDIIKSEVAGSERIVSDLLDSVRTKPPHPEMVVITELIGQTLRKYTVPSCVTVKLDIPAALPFLRVDPLQIQQVLRNLISNGVEAMPKGGTLQIRVVENKQDGTVTISVRDNGIGIAPEVLSKLFQPMFTTKARGIGLGLVVVKNLTQANGGSVNVESEVGKGSLFTVTLPVATLPDLNSLTNENWGKGQ